MTVRNECYTRNWTSYPSVVDVDIPGQINPPDQVENISQVRCRLPGTRLRELAVMSTLFIEAFGQLSGTATINFREEDLYSVFRERAELMHWVTTSSDRPLLWLMEEAEITADTDPFRIGWVQVGLDVGKIGAFVEPARPSPPPVQGWAYAPLAVHRSDIEPALVRYRHWFNVSMTHSADLAPSSCPDSR